MPDLPYWRLAGFYLAYFLVLGAFTPYWSLFLTDRGVGPTGLSLLMSLTWATRLVTPELWRRISERDGRIGHWLRVGAICTGVSFLLFVPDLGQHPLTLVLITAGMLLFTGFHNAILPQADALVLGHLGPRATSYGRIRVWGSIGFIAAVLMFGALLQHLPIDQLALWMLPLLALLIAACWQLGGANPNTAAAQASDAPVGLDRQAILRLLLTALLMQASHGPFYVFLSLHLQALGFDEVSIGLLWALGVACEVVVFMFAPRALMRIDVRRLIQLCLAAAVLRWLLTAEFAEHTAVIMFAQAMHALTFGLFHAASVHAALELFPGTQRARGQSLIFAFGAGGGGMLGALLSGPAWEYAAGRGAFLLAALLALLALVVQWMPMPGRRPR